MATYGFDEKKNLVEVPATKEFVVESSGSGDMRLFLPNKMDISIYEDKVEVPAHGSKLVYMFKKLNSYYKNAANIKTFVSAHPNTPDMRQITATTNIMYDSDDDPEIAIKVFNDSDVATHVILDVLVIGEKV